ncbi:helix-turn-helix domain-containing protein [Leucobacter sp. UCMA 4100]|uniref:helix-turn-helix domain-containing protein n=1 Tax=Leucobacter sp. UCMA 4100 TaxID=2810534 RepID=UPI0022EB4D78|nr:helix-turn-helix domain-containing protein [Leucobacter sp. UCMA 4100]MDA3147213.1 helix-turn-helix domain-containing protein [Leucobacter sp. UCMA 4100]
MSHEPVTPVTTSDGEPLPAPGSTAAPAPSATLSSSPLPEDRERWLELLEMLDIDELSADFVQRMSQVEEYQEGKISSADLTKAARGSFRGLIGCMREGSERELESVAFNVGTSRARAGISRTALMTAIRMDYAVLWNALVAVASVDDAQLLLRHADPVWQVVDNYARQAHNGYIAEKEMLTDTRQLAQRALISELVDAKEPRPERIAEIAKALELPLRGPYVLVAAAGAEAQTLRDHLTSEYGARALVTSYYFEGMLVLLMRERTWLTSQELQALRGSELGALILITGLEEIWSGTRLAAELSKLPSSHSGGRRSFDDWPQLVRARLVDTHLEPVLNIEAKLAECSPAERESIEESVRVFLETGSVQEASARLFCHRNTMTNRLRRFTDLTGIDVTVPVEAARVVLAWA